MDERLLQDSDKLVGGESGIGASECSQLLTRLSSPVTPASEYTIEEVIESMKWGLFHVLMWVIFGTFMMLEAMEVMLLAILFPVVQCEWQLSSLQAALLTVLVFTGMLCGAPLWGTLSDKLGRKPIVFISSALASYHGFLGAFSPNITWLYILRFIVGAGLAGAIQINVVLIEFMAAKHRAATALSAQAFWSIGTLFELLLGWAVIPTLGWRYLVAFSSLPIALFLLTWPIVPESVRFLLVSGQNDKALRMLTKVTTMNGFSLPPGQLRAKAVEERGRLTGLFRPEYRRTTLQVFYVWFAAILSYYGISLATTELVSINYCGTPPAAGATNVSSNDCECTGLSSSDYGTIAITACAEMLFLPLSILLADLLGRRRAVSVGLAVMALSFLTLLTCVGSTAGVTGLLFVARGSAASVATMLYLYTQEVFPTHMRAVGLSSAYFAGRIGGMMAPLISQVLLRSSVHAALIVFAILCSSGAIVAFLFPIETNRKWLQ